MTLFNKEIATETSAVKWAITKGVLALKGSPTHSTGWPDRQFFYKGHVVFVEFKRKGKDLERNQPERIDELVERGFTVGVFDNCFHCCNFLEATILSESWRKVDDRPGVCHMILTKRKGVFYAGETVRPSSKKLT